MQSLPNVCDSVREKMFLYRNYTYVGENNGIVSLQDHFKKQIYILLEALIVFLSPPSENLTNVMSNTNNHNMC